MSPYHNGDSYLCNLRSTTSMSDTPNGSLNKKSVQNVRGSHKTSKTSNSTSGIVSGSSKESFQTLVVQVDIEHDEVRLRRQQSQQEEDEEVEMDEANAKKAETRDKDRQNSPNPTPKVNGQPHPVPTPQPGRSKNDRGSQSTTIDGAANKELESDVQGRDQFPNNSENTEEISEDSKTKSVSSPNLCSSPTVSHRARSVASTDFSSSSTTIYGSCKSSFSTGTDDEDDIFYSVDSLIDQTNFSSSSTINAHDYDDEDDSRSINETTITIHLAEDGPGDQEEEERPHTHNGVYSPESDQKYDPMNRTMLSPDTSSSVLSTSTLSLPAAAFSHRRPSLTLRIRPSSSTGVRRKRHQSERKPDDGDDNNDNFRSDKVSEDPSKIWLYRAKNADTLYPDIVLQLDRDEDEKDNMDNEDELFPVLTTEDLLTLAEQDKFPREIQVYVEYDDPEERRKPRESDRPRRRSFMSFTTDSPIFSARRRQRSARPRSESQPNDDDVRREAARKLSNVSRVLIVDDDNAYEDLMQVETLALERRLSRDNLKAIRMLSMLGDELSLDSGETTPVGFEYSDNVLKIRFLLAWKAAELEVKHKKTATETEIPVAATKMYTRPIARCVRYMRIFKLKCTNCFFFIFRIRCGCRDYSDRYADDLAETDSIEAFQQELEVMEHGFARQRTSTKHGTLTGETESIKILNELIERGKLRQDKRNYRNKLSFR